MTNLQFAILAGLVFWIWVPTMWLALRACSAAESIAHTLETVHEAELLGMKDHFATRQAALNRAARALWIDENDKITDKPKTPRFGQGIRA